MESYSPLERRTEPDARAGARGDASREAGPVTEAVRG